MNIIFALLLVKIFLQANITIDNGEFFELTSDENITILGDVNITDNSTFKAGIKSVINVSDNWISNGDFISNFSTINFIGLDSSTVTSDNTFYNLYANKSIIFESNTTQNILNTFSLQNGKISSTITGTQSIIDLSIANYINTKNLEVADSKIIGLAFALNPVGSIDNGNNILWFSIVNDCQNIGSTQSWYDRLSCQNEIDDYNSIKYIVDQNNVSSQVIFDDTINEDIETIEMNDSTKRSGLNIIYKSDHVTDDSCSKDLYVVLYKDGTTTGFKADKKGGCIYEDPTLENWNDFKDSIKVTINKTTPLDKTKHNNSNSVIVIDVNLTKKLVIGGKI